MKRQLMCRNLVVFTFLCAFSACEATLSTTNSTGDDRQVLYILVTGPYPDRNDDGWFAGISLIPAVRLALNQINNRYDFLPDYRLEAIEDNSGCSVTSKTIFSFIENIYYGSKKLVGIIGPGCSGTTLLLAPIISKEGVSLIQLSPSATSPSIEVLNASTTFTIASSIGITESFIAFILHNNWTQVATLYGGGRDVFRTTHFIFNELVDSVDNLTIIESSYVLNEVEQKFFPLDKIIASRARIVVLLAAAQTTQRVLCIAYHKKLFYPHCQWLIYGKSKRGLLTPVKSFSYDGISYNCSKNTMAKVLNGAILDQYRLERENDTQLIPANLTYGKYRKLYAEEFWKHWNEPNVQRIVKESGKDPDGLQPTGDWENTYYDATWAFGMALDKASRKGLNLSSYTYGQPMATRVLVNELHHIEFEGASGHIQLSATKTSQAVISQLWTTADLNVRETVIGFYSKGKLHFVADDKSLFIKDTLDEVPVLVHFSIGITVILVTIVIAIVTVLLQATFIVWSENKSVKATSPDISHMIFSGCYLFALTTILYTVQQILKVNSNSTTLQMVYAVLCNVITWCLLIGFSLIFGTVLVKVWRVYKLFRHFRNKSPGIFLSDRALSVAVLAFVFVDCVICITWNVFDPWLFKLTNAIISNNVNGHPIVMVSFSCSCKSQTLWIAAVAVYKGAIALLLVVFSILNRKIQRKHFSHTKKINILVYSLTLLGGVGFPLYFLLVNTNIHASFLILCVTLMLTVIMCWVTLFLPPIIPALKKALGKHEIDGSHTVQTGQTYLKSSEGTLSRT